MATAGLTEALVRLHGGSRADTYGVALLDVAQDHLLWLLQELGHFDDGGLVFKGGTSLRKCRLGTTGRFSTDLDFAAPSDDKVLEVCEAIDGATISGFRYSLETTRGDGRHWQLNVAHHELGTPDVPAAVEFARRSLVLLPERLEFVPLSIHQKYEMKLPPLPIIQVAEACAEKLARYRRVPLARDVYDLAQFAARPLDEPLVRRLWVLKVWQDVVDDNRGERPLAPQDILTPRSPDEFPPESLGKLVQPVDVPAWETAVRTRFQFLADLDEEEQRWAGCDPRHRDEVSEAAKELSDS